MSRQLTRPGEPCTESGFPTLLPGDPGTGRTLASRPATPALWARTPMSAAAQRTRANLPAAAHRTTAGEPVNMGRAYLPQCTRADHPVLRRGGPIAEAHPRRAERRVGARLSAGASRGLAPRYGPTRERLSVCLFIGALGVNFRICRDEVWQRPPWGRSGPGAAARR